MAKKVSLPKTKILWIEGRWTSNDALVPTLRKKGFTVETVSNGKEALNFVSKGEHDIVVVDAASMRTSGSRICKALRERVNGMPIMLISDPSRPVDEDLGCANQVLELPFTPRKLINRIEPLLPTDEDKMLKAGPVRLDMERRQVSCQGVKTTLTPRLARLLKMLMDHKGDVVEREELFKKVWRTDYTGDTRTLDVHISWLRLALEKDPRKPKILKTIRGVGYRLDV
ncbi:MAG: response regulator transcription factor [Verrucomicrobiales bacterium]|nr:response regulator transcription factor [Verrucomicrobiales bacterium]